MGNQCCDKQAKNLEEEKATTQVFDDKEIPPTDNENPRKPAFYRVHTDSVHSNDHSKSQSHNNRNGHYASITPPSLKGQHPPHIWNKLENDSIPPTEFFASNFDWRQRQSLVNRTGFRSSIRFSYSNGKSALKNDVENDIEIANSQIRFTTQNKTKISAFNPIGRIDTTV